MVSSLFEVRFGTVEDFLAELAADTPLAIVGGIVRLAVVTGPAPGSLPVQMVKSFYVEASYVSTRNQLVKLSVNCGWHFVDGRKNDRTAPVEDKVAEVSHKLQAAVRAHKTLTLRGGSLAEAGHAWSIGDLDIQKPPSEVCATCGEAIYFANQHWRHAATKAAGVFTDEPCPRCGGGKLVREAPRFRDDPCPVCRLHPGVKRTLDHLADPIIEGRQI